MVTATVVGRRRRLKQDADRAYAKVLGMPTGLEETGKNQDRNHACLGAPMERD